MLKQVIKMMGILFLMLMYMCPVAVEAQENIVKGEDEGLYWNNNDKYKFAQIGGIYYTKMSSDEAAVTYNLKNPDMVYTGKVVIPEKITYQGSEYVVSSILTKAFLYSEATFVYVPNSVKRIDDYAFDSSKKLTAITLPSSLNSIGESAFGSCSALKAIKLPNTLLKIEKYTFGNCESLVSIDIPNSVTSIGEGAFYRCKKLNTVKIPESVTVIAKWAFADCDNLSCVKVPVNTKIEEGAFPDHTKIIRE